MKPLYPTKFRYSIRIPIHENEISQYNGVSDCKHGTVRYDTIHRFEIGEIIHIPINDENDIEELSFQVCEIVRAFEALPNLTNKIGGFCQQLEESGNHILVFHVFGKRLPNSKHLLY